jgi:ferredoxin--NADP+ reductase
VAPDHPKIKSVTRMYERIAAHPGFRFLGNVRIGGGIEHDELMALYDAVIYATGAQTDRHLGIPGEELAGSHAATEFVGWYNGHPDYRDRRFELSSSAAVVVGMGNVAMDVTRILASSMDELTPTDLSLHALEAFRNRKVETIYVLGRRGPAQAAFTNPELKELGALAEADVIVDPKETQLDEHSAHQLTGHEDRAAEKNLHTLHEFAARKPQGKKRRIVLRFLVSPIEILGNSRVEGVKLAKNRLVRAPGNELKAEATGETELLPAGLIFRSVGYKGVPVPGVPFDQRAGVIPNVEGRVLVAPGALEMRRGVYAVGWIKRGPSGVIGTNKPDSAETADLLLHDVAAGIITPRLRGSRTMVDQLLQSRGLQVVSFDDWNRHDEHERASGKARGAPREKFTRIPEMLAALNGTA